MFIQKMNDVIRASISFTPRDLKYLKDSFEQLLFNITSNRYTFDQPIDPGSFPFYAPFIEKWCIAFNAQFPITWKIYKNNIPMNLTLLTTKKRSNWIIIEPCEPFKMRPSLIDDQQIIDMNFYINCCLEITDNFIIYDLRTIEKDALNINFNSSTLTEAQ